MAWLCTGKTNAELIANMQSAGLIHSTRVAEVGVRSYLGHATRRPRKLCFAEIPLQGV